MRFREWRILATAEVPQAQRLGPKATLINVRSSRIATVQADQDTKRAALGYAVALIGSLGRTAAHFGADIKQMRAWLEGGEAVPKGVFHAAVELLLAAQPADLDEAKERLGASNLPAPTAALERLLNKAP